MLIFYHQNLKEENYKCFGGKLMQKLDEKILKKKLKIGTTNLAHKTGPARRLNRSIKGVGSNGEIYIEITSFLMNTSQSLSISNKRNPPSITILPFSSFIHPSSSSIRINP